MADPMDVDLAEGEALLAPPSPNLVDALSAKLPRSEGEYESSADRFALAPGIKANQYFKLYGHRLAQMRPWVLKEAHATWDEHEQGPMIVQDKVLNTVVGHRCVIVGALIKEIALKPNLLAEYSSDVRATTLYKAISYISDDDYLLCEDESGRTKLKGDFNVADYVTVVALIGEGGEGGEFIVSHVVTPSFAPQPALPAEDGDPLVAIVSGLSFGLDDVNPLHAQLLIDYIDGNLGGPADHALQSRIVRVIVAGNSLVENKDVDLNTTIFSKSDRKTLTRVADVCDRAFHALASSVPLDVLPGATDPSDYSLPQQPLRALLFPRFVGHAGQPIDNAAMYMRAESRLHIARTLLKWRHLAPTAPDLLSVYPGPTDPFVVTSSPHVFFAGNQPAFETELIEDDGVRLRIVMLPSFATTNSFALVNLRTLKCTRVQVNTWDD